MEIIPQETIDIIDDFINHLSPEQFLEFGERYLGKYEHLDGIINAAAEELKNPDAKELMARLHVMTLKCFDYYAIELPAIPLTIAQSEMMKWGSHISKINPNFPDKAKLSLLRKSVTQRHLADYIFNHIFEIPENLALFKKSEILPSVVVFYLTLNVFHNYVESVLPKEE